MSRGGRGGFPGGRGGAATSRRTLGGVDVTWEWNPEVQVDTAPADLFPPMEPTIARSPTRVERKQVAKYRSLRDRIHEGPLYTVLGVDARVTKPGSKKGIGYDIFNSMPTWSNQFKREKRKIPRLDTRPYVKKFFPEELWLTLDPKTASTTSGLVAKKKRLKLARTNKLNRLEEFDEENEKTRQEDAEDDDKTLDGGSDEGDVQEEVLDDDFEEAEDDDEPDDYNAEQYFDNGEEDYEDGGGGGGDYDDSF